MKLELGKTGEKLKGMRGKGLPGPIRDLHEQRLLPVVAVLILAIPAVLIVFGGSSAEEPAGASATAAEISSAGSDDGFTVVADTPELRNHLDRFEGDRPRDPFRGPGSPVIATESGSGSGSSGGGRAGEPTPGAGGDATVTDDGGSDGSSSSNSFGGGSSGSSSSSGSSPSSGGGTTTITRTEYVVIDVRASVKFGRAGSGKSHTLKHLPRLTPLPFGRRPAAVYLGASEDRSTAIFSISSDVTGISGKGRCSSGRGDDCGYLLLRPGRAVNLHDARRGTVWRLGLSAIDLVETELDLIEEIAGRPGKPRKRGGDAEQEGGGQGSGGDATEPVTGAG